MTLINKLHAGEVVLRKGVTSDLQWILSNRGFSPSSCPPTPVQKTKMAFANLEEQRGKISTLLPIVII